MDAFDKKILAQLQQNARQSISAIADSVSLSRSAVSERIKRMEDLGEILGYQVICKSSEDHLVKAYFEVRHGGYHCESIAKEAMLIEGIRYSHGISGELDLLLYAEVASMVELHAVRSQLDKIPNVGKITTHVVMQEWLA